MNCWHCCERTGWLAAVSPPAADGLVWLLCSWAAAGWWRPSASWPCESPQGHCRFTTGSLLPECRHPANSSQQHTTAAVCDVTSLTWRASHTRSKLHRAAAALDRVPTAGDCCCCWRLLHWVSLTACVSVDSRYLAQVMHESIGLSTTKEIGGEHASYAPYYGAEKCSKGTSLGTPSLSRIMLRMSVRIS